MTDNITLPRAVVEQVREALTCGDGESRHWCMHCDDHVPNSLGSLDILDALDAALAEPDAKREPVHPGYLIGSHWLETAYSRIAAGEAEADVLAEVLGARGWAKPEPATNKEIDAEWLKIKPVLYPMYGLGDFRDGFRAAERFHGIRKEDGK
jgi:hypothetical protein